MTLDTTIVIGKPYNVHEVFQYCRELLGCAPDVPFKQGVSEWRNCKQILNPCGIGLPAWLWIYYGADGPLLEQPDDPNDADEVEYIASHPGKNGWGAIEVSFDTAYSYRSEEGENCSQLHARLVAQLGKWLDDRGLPWKWQNEYTGEWFDRYDGLAEFVDAHRSTGAADWFNNIVLPVIERGALR